MKTTASPLTRTGFTLIELLIVIALLGALAVGLLAAIDPFEQLKKGRDTATRNSVSEFYNANLRYYANKGVFPWEEGSFTGVKTMTNMTTEVNELIAAGELKNRFMELVGGAAAKIYVNSNAPDHLAVCFKPESKSFQVDNNTVYDQDGAPASGTCKSQNAATGVDCYFCIQ